MMIHKFSPGAVIPAAGLSARQIKVVASDATPDRDGDVMDPAGCDFSAYRKNPIVLAAHDQKQPIGTAAVARTPSVIEALISFAPLGASRTADEFCALAKAGVLSAVSVGFRPIDAEPIKNGRGVLWKAWELLELSLVAVPSNPNAVVMERAFGKDGRVLAGQHADALMRAHQRITSAQKDIHDVLKAAGRIPADDGDGYDPEADEPDEELSFDAARLKREQMRGRGLDPDADRRKRLVTVAAARTVTLPAFDAARRKGERAADLASLDYVDVGARAKSPTPPAELRGGPWMVRAVREAEEARLRAFWDRPLK
jgi:HK97 family phage prohead protease